MRNKFIISVLIPVLILAAMTIQPLMTLFAGQEIKLKTQPVDPTDLFRGDYVILSYEINDINISQFPQLDAVKSSLLDKDRLWDYEKSREYYRKQVYVTLKEANGVYVVDSAGFEKPEHKLYLTGRISYFFNKMPIEPVSEPGKTPASEPAEPARPVKPVKEEPNVPDTVKVEYQLDKYFVPENTGLKLEEMSRKGQLLATIKIYNGYALLVKIEEAP